MQMIERAGLPHPHAGDAALQPCQRLIQGGIDHIARRVVPVGKEMLELGGDVVGEPVARQMLDLHDAVRAPPCPATAAWRTSAGIASITPAGTKPSSSRSRSMLTSGDGAPPWPVMAIRQPVAADTAPMSSPLATLTPLAKL